MLKGHQDMLWLAGQVLLSRDFVKEAETEGLEAIFAACPYGDLTKEEKTAFASAFKNESLRAVIKTWWKTYNEEREAGTVPKASSFWE